MYDFYLYLQNRGVCKSRSKKYPGNEQKCRLIFTGPHATTAYIRVPFRAIAIRTSNPTRLDISFIFNALIETSHLDPYAINKFI
jgi:hypothetical protein